MSIRPVAVALVALALTGCYHATIDTGLAPSGETISVPWAHGFVYGLVPPSTVDAAEECPNGVAQVETQLSFLNQLANLLTFGIYSPMTIEVQCAAGGDDMDASAAIDVPADATPTERADAIGAAAQQSRESGEPVAVMFR
jgi:hypothetical protein